MINRKLGLVEDSFVFEAVGEIGCVGVVTCGPFLGFALGRFAVAEVFHEGSGSVFEPDRDGVIGGLVGEGFCAGPSVVGATAFGGFAEGDDDVREDDVALGHADAFDGLESGEGEGEGVVAGEADVF